MSWYFDLCCYFCKKLSVSQQENKQDPVISQIMSVLFDSSVNLEMWDCRSPKPQSRSFTTWPGLTDGPIGGRLPDPIPYPHTWCNKGWAELVNCWWASDYAWLSIARKQHNVNDKQIMFMIIMIIINFLKQHNVNDKQIMLMIIIIIINFRSSIMLMISR